MNEDQLRLGNNWERTVIGTEEIDRDVFAREVARYEFAATYMKDGMSVLEFGCSSGFGTRFFPPNIRYTGVDYSKEIVKYAKEKFGAPNRRFVWSSIDKFLADIKDRKWDVIVAFEVLEHVPNGREVAQELKKHCKTLLCTTPYREPVGFWGPHHVLHGLSEKDFPQFEYRFMHMNGDIRNTPTREIANLLLMVWEEGKVYQDRKRVLCAIPTRNRYNALMQCLQSVAMQTVRPDKVVIYDDGDHLDMRQHESGRYVFPLLMKYGIEWEVVFLNGNGQHIAHQIANLSGYDFVWRLDDDQVAEPDVLERLLAHMKDDVGAVGGAVYEIEKQVPGGTNQLPDFFDTPNFQWAPNQGTREVDFLYSSFLYRAGVVDYKHNMSPVAFHEETIFTHRLRRAGWKLIADTSIHTYHFKALGGGCREIDQKWAYGWDHLEFMRVMEQEWGVKLIHLGVGLGDNFVFKHILPDLKKKYQLVILGSCYPEVFEGERGIKIIPYDKAKESSSDNVYDWMAERNWKGHILDAFREMYGVAS